VVDNLSCRIGIDLGGTKIEGVALSADGTEAARRRLSAPRDDYDKTLSAIADLVEDLSQIATCALPIGVGIPGTISPATGIVKNANSTWLIGHPIHRDLEARLSRPVRLANDANCFALSEAADGAAWGHNPLPWPDPTEMPGPKCYCGKHGCIETFLSGHGFTSDHLRVTGVELTAAAIADGADADGARAKTRCTDTPIVSRRL